MNEQNNINRDLCEYLVDLGHKLAEAESKTETYSLHGRDYLVMNGKATEIRERDLERPETKQIFTLQGLVDFIKADVDHLFQDIGHRHIVSVMSPYLVKIVSPLCGQENIRHAIAKCEYEAERIPFGCQMTQDDFVVMMQSRFVETDSRALVLKVVGNMSDQQSNTTADDGVTQQLTVKKGVVTNGTVSFQNPAYLQPIRTFTEVEQPESPFVLRVTPGDAEKKTPTTVALHECDGGAWKIQAVRTIGAFLREALEGCNVEVIA